MRCKLCRPICDSLKKYIDQYYIAKRAFNEMQKVSIT